MAKRRFIQQLPVVNQTKTLQQWFNATVDQVFQPGQSQSINAFIGRKPSYFNELTDFYKQEINTERTFYQLEPAMTSRDSSGTTTDMLFYQDVVNSLRFHGANVEDHQRLFETEYYSWCPPVNIHKLENFREYFWLPDGPPILVITIPTVSTSVVADVFNYTLTMPETIEGATDEIVVKAGDTVITNYTFAGNDITIKFLAETLPTPGTIITVWRNGNFAQNIVGKATYKHPVASTAYAIEVRKKFTSTEIDRGWSTQVEEGDTVTDYWSVNSAATWDVAVENVEENFVYTYPEIELQNTPQLKRGMRVEIRDNNVTQFKYVDIIDGKISFVDNLGLRYRRVEPIYWLVERGSANENPWSRGNNWFHRDLVFYSGNDYNPFRAQRPIIEFFHDLKMFDYGVNRLPDVNFFYDSSETEFSMFDWEAEGKTEATVDGQNLEINHSVIGATSLDGKILQEGDLILVKRTADASIANKIYRVETGYEENLFDEEEWGEHFWDSGDVVELQLELTPQRYDVVRLKGEASTTTMLYDEIITEFSENNWGYTVPNELWFNVTSWQPVQAYTNAEPLFSLYDNMDVPLLDYPKSSFAGSKLFSYSRGSSTYDSVLGFNPKRNKYGSYTFTNNLFEDTITYQDGDITGYKYYAQTKVVNGQSVLEYHNDWRYAGETTQAKDATTGLYEIPQNLQANPDSQDITEITRNDWYQHFKPVIEGNDWSLKSDYFVLNTGMKIVQNKHNLLKVMLMNANADLDLSKAIMYVEREYVRYRNKFSQFVNNLYNSSAITSPYDSMIAALKQLKITKTPEFAFYNNGVAGDWFIPASGAYLGLTPVNKPEYILEKGRNGTTVMIRAHDGSIKATRTRFDSLNTSLVNGGVLVDGVVQPIDIRDQVIMEFENFIYASIDPVITARRRPLFDLTKFVSGRFRTADYSRDDMLAVARPMFERWVAFNQTNYRENKIFDQNNRFTWNYRGATDKAGNKLPGFWRGIYMHYFDTVRPHTHPWEMLGFTDKPAFWDATYNWTDKRAALITALKTGNIGTPSAPVLDTTWARTDIESYLPVSATGDLLDPVAAGIVTDEGLITDYSADWEYGDLAPVEYSWWTSDYKSFSQAHLSYLMKPARFTDSTWYSLIDDSGAENHIAKHFSEYVIHNEVVNKIPQRQIGLQQWLSDYVRSRGQDITTTIGNRVRGLGVNLAHKVGGFTDGQSMKASTENSGLIPSEDINVALYRSPSIREEFYGGVIVEVTKRGWRVYGYDSTDPVFKINPVITSGKFVKIKVSEQAEVVSNEWRPNTYYPLNVKVTHNGTLYQCKETHTSAKAFEQTYWEALTGQLPKPTPTALYYTEHDTDIETVPYGTEFYSIQDVVNFMSGYSAYLENSGWVFDSYDSNVNDTRDWRLAAREFLFWAQVTWQTGTFLSLSPLSENVKFTTDHGSIQSIEQIVNGAYSILNREGGAIDNKLVNVYRMDGEINVSSSEPIFGLRVFISEIEHCVVFNNKTIFGDVIYDPMYNLRQNRIRMNFLVSTDWTGRLDAPGYLLTDNLMMPSFDRQVEDIRDMFSIEKATNPTLRDHARHQSGYQSRDYLGNMMSNEVNQFEFYQGMIKQKGSLGVLSKLMRNNSLTQTRNLSFLEEWAFRVGNYGGVNQTQVFEFELSREDIKQDPQLVELITVAPGTDLDAIDDVDDLSVKLYTDGTKFSSDWVMPPTSTALFEEEADYTRHASDLPTAGYARLGEATVSALSYATLNADIQAGNVVLDTDSRVWVYVNENKSWDMLRVDTALAATQPNDEQNYLVDFFGDSVECVVTTLYAHTLVAGDYICIAGPSNTTPDMGGVYKVTAVTANTITFKTDTVVSATFEPSTDGSSTAEMPMFLKAFSVRFNENNLAGTQNLIKLSSLTKAQLGMSAVDFVIGETVYVDAGYELSFIYKHGQAKSEPRWAVYAFDGTQFNRTRVQPQRVRRDRITAAKLFDTVTKRTDRELQANPLIHEGILIFDAVQGLIPGVANREIWFRLEYDPAHYNSTGTFTGMEWGAEEVGQTWWDLNTTRFIMSETDDLNTTAYKTSELTYRITNWGKLAPGASVDIYEWTESDISPVAWTEKRTAGSDLDVYDGDVYNSSNPQWVEKSVWDAELGKNITKYYFWVKNRLNAPGKADRKMAAYDISTIITSPTLTGFSWVAPLTKTSMLVNGISQFLTETSSLQFSVKKNDARVNKHAEWKLMREGDDSSQPTDQMWSNLCFSFSGRKPNGDKLPNTSLHASMQTGNDIHSGQSWFADLKTARKHLVEYLNNVFANILLVDDRPTAMTALSAIEPSTEYLQWSQSSDSLYQDNLPPANLWDYQLMTQGAYDRNAALTGPALIYNAAGLTPFWSVVRKDETGTSAIDVRYNKQVGNMTDLFNLTNETIGTRVLVSPNSETSNYWSVWEYTADGFKCAWMQRYQTSDVWNIVDWYATGYDVTKAPSAVYATVNERNLELGTTNPIISFVKVNDDGQGRWMWTVFQDGQWTTVAKQNGTIQFKDTLWQNTGNANLDVMLGKDEIPTDFQAIVAARDYGNEINVILNVLREKVFTQLEMNALFFDVVNYIHTEQDFVDWCFKTSFMSITGFDEKLQASPIANFDFLSDLLSYINEVKPYHVKVRNFISKYGVQDEASVHATDFDFPAYKDPATGQIRVLDPNVPADLAIMQTGEYKDYYQNWSQNNSSKVRKTKMSIKFDRVSLDPNDTSDTAMARLKRYQPDFDLTKLSTVQRGVKFNGRILNTGNFTIPVTFQPWDNTQMPFVENTDGMLVPATTAPSFVKFGRKFDASHVLESVFDTDGNPWDAPYDGWTADEDLWGDLHNVWEGTNDSTWESYDGLRGAHWIYDSYKVSFTVSDFDANAGHRVIVYLNNQRLSLAKGDYVIRTWPNQPNVYHIYLAIDPMDADDQLVVLVVDKMTPDSVFDGGKFGNSITQTGTSSTVSIPLDADALNNLDSIRVFYDLTTIDGSLSGSEQIALAYSSGHYIAAQDYTINFANGTVDIPSQPVGRVFTLVYDTDPAVFGTLNGSTFEDPYHAANHPEELVMVHMHEALSIRINQKWKPGAPQMLHVEDHTASSPVFNVLQVPQSTQAVAVYKDGVRQLKAAYKYDPQACAVEYLGTASNLHVVTWGFGGDNVIISSKTAIGDGTNKVFTNTDAIAANEVMVTVNGVLMDSGFTATGGKVTFTTAPAVNAIVLMTATLKASSGTAFTKIRTYEYFVPNMGTQSLNTYTGLTGLTMNNSFVEVDGRRVDTDGPNKNLDLAGSFVAQYPSALNVIVTVFENPESLGIQTLSHIEADPTISGEANIYPIPGSFAKAKDLWVWEDGVKLRMHYDYDIVGINDGFDPYGFDDNHRWDYDDSLPDYQYGVRLKHPLVAGRKIIVTTFSGTPSTAEKGWMMFMDPLRDFGIKDKITKIESAFTLVSALDLNTRTITLKQTPSAGSRDIASYVKTGPGFILIGNELIEYRDIAVDVTTQQLTISNVIRGSRGTTILPQSLGSNGYFINDLITDKRQLP